MPFDNPLAGAVVQKKNTEIVFATNKSGTAVVLVASAVVAVAMECL